MRPHRLGKILENCLSRVGLQQRIQEQKILDAWERMVGKAIAEMTEPVRVKNRVLQVKVTNSVWMHELQFHKKLIIQKLNDVQETCGTGPVVFYRREGGRKGSPSGGRKK